MAARDGVMLGSFFGWFRFVRLFGVFRGGAVGFVYFFLVIGVEWVYAYGGAMEFVWLIPDFGGDVDWVV